MTRTSPRWNSLPPPNQVRSCARVSRRSLAESHRTPPDALRNVRAPFQRSIPAPTCQRRIPLAQSATSS